MATKRKDGRLMQSITDDRTGKRVYFYGKTKAELNRQILAYRETAASGRPFSTVANEWWKKEEPRLAVQSIKVYLPALRRAIAFFGSRCLSEITHQDIALYLKDLADAGFAAKTVSNHRIVVNKVFTYAIASDGLTHNPCASVPVPKGLAKVKRDAASKEDENIVLTSPDKWIYPYIAILTGMRKGEILALQWRDVDFDRDLIRVTKSVAHKGDTPFIKEPKTSAGCRVVPLLPALREELWARKGRQDHFIVSDDGTKPLTKRRYATLMKHYKQDTGFTATAHRLRHSFATLAFEENVPAKSLQEILGHKQLSTTMDTYTDFREKALRDAAEAMKTIGTKKP